MKYDVAHELYKLMTKAKELVAEAVEVEKVWLNDEDIAILRKKAGERVISLAKEDLQNSIKKDAADVDTQLEGFVCEYVQVVESNVRSMLSYLIKDIFDRYFGGYDQLHEEQRIKIGQMVEERIEIHMRNLTNIRKKR